MLCAPQPFPSCHIAVLTVHTEGRFHAILFASSPMYSWRKKILASLSSSVLVCLIISASSLVGTNVATVVCQVLTASKSFPLATLIKALFVTASVFASVRQPLDPSYLGDFLQERRPELGTSSDRLAIVSKYNPWDVGTRGNFRWTVDKETPTHGGAYAAWLLPLNEAIHSLQGFLW